MANKKVSQLTSKPSVLVTDLFPIADPTTGQLYKTTISDLGTAIGSGVSSVNGLVGAVVLDTDDIQELVSPTNKWFTDTRARAAISAGTGISYNSGTGVITNAVTSGQIATALGYTPADDSLVVKLAGTQTITGTKTFSSAVTSTNFVLSGGTGNTGLYFGHTDKVVLANYVTGGGLDFETNGGNITMQLSSAGNLSAVGTITGSSIIKSGGTSSQFLKADGSVDSSTYALDSAVVHNTGNETVAGQKTFSSTLYGASAVFSSAVNVQSINVTGITASPSVYITTNGSNHAVSIVQSGAGYAIYASGNVAVIGTGYFSSSLTAASLASTAGYNYTLPSASGTLALTSQLSSYLPLAGGTLTGALSGTSASFSAEIQSNSYLQSKLGASNTIGSGSRFQWDNNASGASQRQLALQMNANYGLDLFYFNGSTYDNIGISLASDGSIYSGRDFRTDLGSVLVGAGSNNYYTKVSTAYNYPYVDSYFDSVAGSSYEGRITFRTSTGGGSLSNKMTITNAGNVGIGTTAPGGKLDINGDWTPGSSTVKVYPITSFASGGVSGYGVFDSNGTTRKAYFNASSNYVEVWGQANVPMTFGTNDTERMRITSGGFVLIGSTAADPVSTNVAGISFEGSLGSGKFSRINNACLDVNRVGGTDGEVIRMYKTGSQVGNISVTSSSTSYNTSSDYRLKQDFKSVDGLDLVNRINVYNYEWKSDKTRMDGVIAHELQEVLPYAVTGVKDGAEMQSVDYSKIVPVMVQAIKDLKAKIETLENK